MRSITPERTAKRLEEAFPEEAITITLKETLVQGIYAEWKDIRNILAHRTAPGRVIYLATKKPPRDFACGRPGAWPIRPSQYGESTHTAAKPLDTATLVQYTAQ
jgi:hypothetical protein